MGCCRCGDGCGGCCLVAPGAASAARLGGGNDGSNRSRTCAGDCCCRCWGATPSGVPAAPDGGKDGFHAAAAGPLCPPVCALAVGPGCWDCLARSRPASVALTWSCRRGKRVRSSEVETPIHWWSTCLANAGFGRPAAGHLNPVDSVSERSPHVGHGPAHQPCTPRTWFSIICVAALNRWACSQQTETHLIGGGFLEHYNGPVLQPRQHQRAAVQLRPAAEAAQTGHSCSGSAVCHYLACGNAGGEGGWKAHCCCRSSASAMCKNKPRGLTAG